MQPVLRTLFYLLAFYLLLSTGCTPAPTPTIYLSEEFKAYTDFPVGSWWVYENINNLSQTDSFYVVERGQDFLQERGQKFQTQRLYYKLVRYSKLINKIDTIGFEAIIDPDIDNRFSYLYTHKSVSLFGFEIFYFPGNINDRLIRDDGPSILSVEDSLLVHNTYFYQTITTYFKNSTYGNFIQSETYAKGVGVIRRSYFNGEVYQLKNYYINN